MDVLLRKKAGAWIRLGGALVIASLVMASDLGFPVLVTAAPGDTGDLVAQNAIRGRILLERPPHLERDLDAWEASEAGYDKLPAHSARDLVARDETQPVLTRVAGLTLDAGEDVLKTAAIDPTLPWNTFLGGTGSEIVRGMAVDGSGNVYVAGDTTAAWGSPVRAYSANMDVYVAKLDASGNLVWSTFLGGLGTDSAWSLAADGSGNVYVAGYSDATWGSPARLFTASDDAFVARLDTNGNLVWHAFLGSTSLDRALGVAVDGTGSVYAVGWSTDSWGSPVRAYSTGVEAFVAKLDATGGLVWNTFIGDSGRDEAVGVTADGAGNVFVVGESTASWGSPMRTYTGGEDAFAAKLDTGGHLLWSTFLGGTSNDRANDVALDGDGNVYLVGWSTAASWGSPERDYSGSFDAYMAKLTPSGALAWNTFLGGSGGDQGFDLVVDGSGNAYMTGWSTAGWGTPLQAYMGGGDAFVVKVSAGGGLTCSTFVGGSAIDVAWGIGLDADNDVYLAGHSSASWGTPVRPFSVSYDSFVTKLGPLCPPSAEAGGPYSGNPGAPVAIDEATATDLDGDPMTYAWSVDDSDACSFNDASVLRPEVTCDTEGVYTVSLTVHGAGTEASVATAVVLVGSCIALRVNEFDFNGDSAIDRRDSTTDVLDTRGNVVGRVSEVDMMGDGTIDSRTTTTYVYDEQGNLVTTVSESDFDADGSPNSRTTTTNTYDADGNLVTTVFESDFDADGSPNSRTTTTTTYDTDGNLVTTVSESDFDADGSPNSRSTTTYTYDTDGNLVSTVFEFDFDVDGSPNSRTTTSNTYDTDGNLVTTVSESDSDADGSPNSRSTTTNTYDTDGNLVTTVFEPDFDADGSPNSRSTTTNTYDADGNLVTTVFESDFDADGSPNSRTTTTNTYDADGNLVTTVAESDFDADGSPNSRTTTTNSYDTDGNQLTRVVDSDRDGNGTVESRIAETWTYDAVGNLVTHVREIDNGADGTVESVTTETFVSECVNEPPTASAGGAYSGHEGAAIPLDGATASDADGDVLSIAWTVDEPSRCSFSDDTTLAPALTCDDNGDFVVTLTVDDGVADPVSSDAIVTVDNVAPSVGPVSVPAAPIDLADQPVTGISASYTDPAAADTHTCSVDFGDGTGDHAGFAAGGICTAPRYAYAEPGVYAVTVTVIDDDGGSGGATATAFVVIYDPDGGFVTGAGWIDSPAGAYLADPTLTGKAHFGFVARYKSGATVPEGSTNFRFSAGDLRFDATDIEWLVLAGSNKAKFKGHGTINGLGYFGFMLTAVDAGPSGDTFRIKIWNEDAGDEVVYDNKLGAGDGAYDGTVIGGGNIRVHRP